MTTTLVENKYKEDGTATFVLDINTQMWTDLYVTPEHDKPETYEDENKKFTLNRDQYEEIRVKLLKKTQELQTDIYKCMGYEAAGLTYSQVDWANGRIPPDGVPDHRYTASEDLMFLYSSLSEIWNCVFELDCVFD